MGLKKERTVVMMMVLLVIVMMILWYFFDLWCLGGRSFEDLSNSLKKFWCTGNCETRCEDGLNERRGIAVWVQGLNKFDELLGVLKRLGRTWFDVVWRRVSVHVAFLGIRERLNITTRVSAFSRAYSNECSLT